MKSGIKKIKIKKVSLILSAVVMIAMMLSSCGGDGSNEESAIKEVTIGSQVWMIENLNIDRFRNGDPIPVAKTKEEWVKAGENKQPAWCYYENDSINGEKYGKLYNWYAVSDSRGLAPKGWHIPSDEEWKTLSDHLGEGTNNYSGRGKKMKSTSGWKDDGSGTNESGFSGLPGGFRGSAGKFYFIGSLGSWWSSTEFSTGSAWNRDLGSSTGRLGMSDVGKGHGFSVRCLRD